MKTYFFITHKIRDIACVVSVVSQFIHDLRKRHMQAVDKII